MNKYISTILLACFSTFLLAQVGIKTTNCPANSALHIDPKGDTQSAGTVNNSDDVYVSSTGAMGLGTITPATKLDIMGSLKITDGSEGLGRIFTATDASGLGSWQVLSLVKRAAVWRVSGNPSSIVANSLYTINGTTSFSTNTLNATTNGTNSITIPAGSYLIFIRGDINLREYGRMHVYSNGALIYFKWYSEYLGGGTIYHEFTSDATLTVGFLGVDVTCSTCTQIPFLSPYPYTGNPLTIWSELVVLQL